MRYNSQKRPGCDYSRPAKDMIAEVIADQALTIPQMADRIGRSEQVIRNIINKMRETPGVLHIESWVFGSGMRTPRYRFGPGEDAPKPANLTNAEKSLRYRSTENGRRVAKECNVRWHKSERGKEYRSNYQKARWAKQKFEQKGLAHIDPLMAAIMGGGRAGT